MLWKKNLQTVPEPTNTTSEKGHTSVVGVHEFYENDELLQDWQDVYITSAYLIWCQTNRRKKRKAKSTGSIRKDSRRVTFKDVTEDMIPAAMEKTKPKRPEPRRSPTVGLPYGPSRASSHHRQVYVQHLDLASYGVAVDKELALGVEVPPKQQSSPRGEETGAKPLRAELNKQLKTADEAEKSLEQTLNDENSRMLLDIDINSHFTPPVEEEHTDEEGGDGMIGTSKQVAKLESNMIKAVTEKLAAREGRVLLPLPSIGVPTNRKPEVKLHHCMNSIPRNLDLGVAMEPVDIVSVTPTPTGTPAEEVTAQGSQLCVLDSSSLDVTLAASEFVSPNDDQMRWPVRGHITSALRYSPTPVQAPAPTPISPDRYGQYSRTSQAREHSTSITSRHMRRRETLSSVYDHDETDLTRETLGSPEGEADELAVEPVFLTQDVLTRDPNLTVLSNRRDMEEWPQEKMIINIIENGDEMPRLVRSPSPGSKTHIPQDILAEFHGDLYGRKEMRIAGQKMMGKPSVSKESQITTDLAGYIAPAWRPPRSRTPIQFLETASRRAPKPLRQPPAESVPRSLTVQPIARRAVQRPKSTPPRISSPRDSKDFHVQQVLSDSSLINSTRDDSEIYSRAVQASSPSVDTCGSIPPPPSPEALLVAPVVPSAPRLDPVSEAEEKSSIASVSVADGTSQVEGGNTVANLSEVEEENEEAELCQQPEKVNPEVKEDERTDVDVKKVINKAESEQNKEVVQPPDLNLQPVCEEFPSISENPVQSSDIANSETLPNQSQPPAGEAESDVRTEEPENQEDNSDKKADENPTENNVTADESLDKEQQQQEEATVPPHPPGSPDILSTPDFTEGLDMNLDLEAELRAAMEGLEELDDNMADGERGGSPELEAW